MSRVLQLPSSSSLRCPQHAALAPHSCKHPILTPLGLLMTSFLPPHLAYHPSLNSTQFPCQGLTAAGALGRLSPRGGTVTGISLQEVICRWGHRLGTVFTVWPPPSCIFRVMLF